MMARRLIVFAGLLLLLAYGVWPNARRTQAAQDPPADGPAEWTLLFYLDADNDLENAQMHDLKEMIAAGSTKDVNIVVLADRHPNGDGRKYSNEAVANLKNWTSAKLLLVEKGNLHEIEDWGEADMGDPATLKKFLQTAKQFPAKHYGVIFGDHGLGWPGACSDESNGDNMLTTQEIGGALTEASTSLGKFELIGFDACLMANLEVAKSVAPAGHVMVASEELEPGDGWNYTPLLQSLARNPKIGGAELGRLIVDTYSDYFAKSPDEGTRQEGDGTTLSVISLDQLTALEKAVSELGINNQAALTKSEDAAFNKIARARSDAEEYGSNGEGDAGTQQFDLRDVTQNLKRQPPDSSVIKAVDAVDAALKNVVLYNKHGRGRPNASGLSIFFPAEKNTLTEKQGKIAYPQTAFSLSAKWLPFLAEYTGADAADTTAPEVAEVETSDTELDSDDVASITTKVKADDIDDIRFVLVKVEDGEQTYLGALPSEPDDKGVVKENWDGEWFTIGDGQKELICPITSFEEISDAEDTYWVVVPAEVRFKGTDQWMRVSLYFNTDFNDEAVTGDFVYAFENTRMGPRQIDLEAGDDLRPVYEVFDKQGKQHFEASDDKEDIFHLTGTADIKVGRGPVDPGTYQIGFVVTDLAGNETRKFTEVKLD